MNDVFQVLKDKFGSHPQKRTILELGAADGGDSEKIAGSVVVNGQLVDYIAFEPDPRNIALLRRSSVASNSWFHIVDAAVGDINAFVPFYECNGASEIMPTGSNHTFSSSVKSPKLHLQVHNWCSFDNHYAVRMVRLDDFLSVFRVGCIDFIWCDIQGAEDLMIAGAQQTLARTRLFYSECYEEEMYDGQIGRHEILKRLPGQWNIANEWENDVLFENLSIK